MIVPSARRHFAISAGASIAEDFDPLYADRKLRSEVRAMVSDAFARADSIMKTSTLE